ncbi:unnamed protein product [Paramecium pentaurelia]|uniref:Uncharacterized protein n=1 Tax=Paramecium pentaurelia TaxID=43138 RepID=A0A8S1RX65_9CILI|nr:unnamed protein product [Paramecium pentaurelia]
MSVMSQNNDPSIKQRDNNRQQITSLNQLSNMYGKSKPGELAQSLVYGDKPKKENNRPSKQMQTTVSEKPNQWQTRTVAVSPSKFTMLSQQLYNHIPDTLEAQKSQRAFHVKDQKLLLSPERLHSLPNQNGDKTPEVCNRLLEYKTFVSDKKQTLKDQLDAEYLSQCSFQPQIDEKSRKMAIKATNQEVRSADEFHEQQMRHLQKVNEKREILQKQQEEDEKAELSSPKLTVKTQKLTLKYSEQPLVERLHEVKSKTQTLPDSTLGHSFKPQISKKSKEIKREESVQDFLYNDAKNRQEQKKQTETMIPQSIISPTDKSQSWFVQRFIKEFYYQLSGLDRVQETKDYSKIYQDDFQKILGGLGFGQCDMLWNELNNGFYVLSRNLLVILLAIQAVPQHLIEIPLYKPKVEENIQVKSKYQCDENGNLILSVSDCQELHKMFYKLYLNTKQQNGNGVRRRMARSPQPEIRCGSPKISDRTKQLAEAKRQDSSLFDWFSQQEEKKKQSLEELKKQVEEERMKECKSIQREITIDLHQLAKPLQKQEDRTTVDVEFDNQQQHCSFQPQISKPAQKTSASNYAIQEMEKQAARMKEARLRQKTLANLKNKGTTTNNTIRRKEKGLTENELNNEPKQKKNKSRPISDKSTPMLYVDVKIEDGKSARIVVFEGDTSVSLANKFAKEHKLDENMKEKLKDLLDQQINSYLMKIEEEQEQEDD